MERGVVSLSLKFLKMYFNFHLYKKDDFFSGRWPNERRRGARRSRGDI